MGKSIVYAYDKGNSIYYRLEDEMSSHFICGGGAPYHEVIRYDGDSVTYKKGTVDRGLIYRWCKSTGQTRRVGDY